MEMGTSRTNPLWAPRSEGANAAVSFEPLDPTSFLTRAALLFGPRIAVEDRDRMTTYSNLDERAWRQATALASLSVVAGDCVAVLAPNSLLAIESHFGVPRAGGVLVMLNTRLSASEIAWILDDCGASVLLCDSELEGLGRAATAQTSGGIDVVVDDGTDAGDYGRMLRASEAPFIDRRGSETSVIAVNYTSGTTGRPKGVLYTHRGAYLQSLAMALHNRLGDDSRYLWTLPMFHCNGWCLIWANVAVGSRNVCVRTVDPADMWHRLRRDGITHFSGAPTVLSSLVWHQEAAAGPLDSVVQVALGGAPPSPALLDRLADLNFRIAHYYGLTETYGPAVGGEIPHEWSELTAKERSVRIARQGNALITGQPARVVDESGLDVPSNAETIGEVMFRGNTVTPGYLEASKSNADVRNSGWLASGDIGVMHGDNRIELRDRSKNIIISGGENITSIEVEQAIASHPAVLEAAVVAVADDRWGEVPGAFVELKDNHDVTPSEIAEHVKEQIARFKAPKHVWFGPLPKNGNGKVQKFELRRRAGQLTDTIQPQSS